MNLSFDQAPPFSVPLRFFLLAPWLGVAAGLVLAWSGGESLASRWTGASLALAHLLGAGFMLQAMCGALFQFVPVAAGGNVWRPRWVAALIQPPLLLGALALSAAFLAGRPDWLPWAAALLLGGVVCFGVPMAAALWRTPARGATIWALRIAVGGLLVTALIGATLAVGMARGWALSFPALTDVHLSWALGVWALALLMGVSYYVVPMFQLTPAYPARTMPWLAPVLLLGVLAASLVPSWRGAGAGIALAAGAVFGGLTLWLQARRRRRTVDATFLLFRLSMVSLIGCAILGLVLLSSPPGGGPLAVTFGILALLGVFASAITGMCYKIVPFVAWLHLQREAGAAMVANMKDIIPEAAMRNQARAHGIAVLLVLTVPWWPALGEAAGLAFAASQAWLGANLIGGARRYAALRNRIRAGDADHGS